MQFSNELTAELESKVIMDAYRQFPERIEIEDVKVDEEFVVIDVTRNW